MRRWLIACLAAVLLGPSLARAQAPAYDIVIRNGRVIDPESGLDAVRSVGIRNGKIVAVSRGALSGRAVIDARGLVVAPGFIDLHAHGQNDENYRLHAMDGVTTALELEVGTGDIPAFYAAYVVSAAGEAIGFGVPGGQVVYFTNKDRLVVQDVVSLERREISGSLPYPPDILRSIVASPDGRTLYYGARQIEANIWLVRRSGAERQP